MYVRQCGEGATSAWYEVSGKVKHVVQSSSWKQVGGVAGLQRAQRTSNPGNPSVGINGFTTNLLLKNS